MTHVQTVTGQLPAERLGFTLPHEHTVCYLWHIPGRWDYWELTPEEDVIAAELGAFQAQGGTCLVDVTLPGIGRDPAWLRRLSERTGLAIVMGAGWYRGAYYPAEARIDQRSVDQLAEQLIREVREGVEGTGVRPGILGEIGTDKPWVSAQEERVFRAVGRAARATGLAVTTHAVMSDVGLAQLRILEEEGVDPARVVIGHADSYPSLDYHLELIHRGANVEFDFLGMSFTPMERTGEPRLITLLCELVARGHADRLLLSHDVCHNQQLRHYEGHGYAYLGETFLPRLRDAGVDEATIGQITVENPRRILSLEGP
ncbi:MAG: phosphotriesterase family protein [Candidatus Limnocylindrales bacterium]